MLLGCIGDDFTGSSDLANTLAKAGMAVVQYSGVPSAPAASSVEAGVIALKSRSIPAAEAIKQSLVALKWLQDQGCKQFFFKYCSTFDSTDDGNIGPVAEALASALAADQVIVCPAFPGTGRAVFQGHLFVKDQLLSDSPMKDHPLTPMRDADLRNVLGRQSRGAVGHVPMAVVAAGSDAIRDTLAAEVHALHTVLETPKRPVAAVVGGAKISTKLAVLEHLIERVDHLILGGGMANTFLAAGGADMGLSLQEADMYDTARKIMTAATAKGCQLHLPVDGVVAETFAEGADNKVVGNDTIGSSEMVLDIGPDSIARACAVLDQCETVLWNGPMGAFEVQPFDKATVQLARHAAMLTAQNKLISVAGGGDAPFNRVTPADFYCTESVDCGCGSREFC